MVVFSLENSGNCVESLINFWGISDQALFKATADRINKDLNSTQPQAWPPTVEKLTQERKTKMRFINS